MSYLRNPGQQEGKFRDNQEISRLDVLHNGPLFASRVRVHGTD